MQFPKHIFKAYDIRGLAATELSTALAYRIGRAFVHFLRSRSGLPAGAAIVVGRDMRETSPELQAAVIRGIQVEGVDVVDIGLATTPLFNFACAHYPHHAGGIMVTASHNPAEYNGFKMTMADGLPVGKNNGMEEIYALVTGMEDAPAAGASQVAQKNVLEDYLARLFSFISPQSIRPLKGVLDGGNGMGDVTFRRLCEALPITIEYLYMDPDGRFPNHEANPIKVETLKDLQAKVIESGADFGFALDGDADRIGLVDEKGEVVDASYVAALIGREVLRIHPGAHMLYDLRSSAIVSETWQDAGATTEMSMIGHAFIKKIMKEKPGTVFASELSLHLYYHDMYDVESSDLSLLYVLQLLSREQKPLSELVAPLKKYVHSGEINFEVKDKGAILKRIEETYAPQALETSRIDGLWLRLPWGWFSVRESNTEPLLRLNLETKTHQETEEHVRNIVSIIQSV